MCKLGTVLCVPLTGLKEKSGGLESFSDLPQYMGHGRQSQDSKTGHCAVKSMFFLQHDRFLSPRGQRLYLRPSCNSITQQRALSEVGVQ